MTTEEIKSELVANVTEFLSNEAKDAVIVWIKGTALPAVKEVAATYTAKLKEQAAQEAGWNKFRDSFFLPMLIDGTIYLIGKAADKMAPAEVVAAQPEQVAQ